MDYSSYSIHLVQPMHELDIDRIFPKSASKRKLIELRPPTKRT